MLYELPWYADACEKVAENGLKNFRLIAIDGSIYQGKTAFGRFASFTLGVPLVETDLFFSCDGSSATHDFEAIRNLIRFQIRSNRPIIVEGICVLKLLAEINQPANFLIYLFTPSSNISKRINCDAELPSYFSDVYLRISHYNDEFKPKEMADLIVPIAPLHPKNLL